MLHHESERKQSGNDCFTCNGQTFRHQMRRPRQLMQTLSGGLNGSL